MHLSVETGLAEERLSTGRARRKALLRRGSAGSEQEAREGRQTHREHRCHRPLLSLGVRLAAG